MTFTPEPDEAIAWAARMFGAPATSKRERALRFIEEAVELAHCAGIDSFTLTVIFNRVYAKEPNPAEMDKEIGQCRMTLAMLAGIFKIDDDEAFAREWHRLQHIPAEQHRARHALKVQQGFAEGEPENEGD